MGALLKFIRDIVVTAAGMVVGLYVFNELLIWF